MRKKKVLDIGCGGGLISEALANHNAIVTGIDENNKKCIKAKIQVYLKLRN